MITNIIQKPEGPFSIDEISKEANCTYHKRNTGISIYNITSLKKAKKGDLSFLDNMKYFNSLNDCKATAIIVPADIHDKLKTKAILLKSNNAYASYAKALQKFYPIKKTKINQINKEIFIKIASNTQVSKKALIENNVEIKSGSIIKSFSTIGPNVIIGRNCIISNNVHISNTVIGDNTIIHSGTVIGSDGFGYAQSKGKFIKIPQIGIVKIGNDVEIGANCTIDRGSLMHTEIRNGVKIDNLVHIAHNVIIKDNTVIAGQTGIAGSTVIGKNVMIGGQVGISGHLQIGNNAKIGAQAGVTKNVKNYASISGTPAVKLSTYLKKSIILNKLAEKK